MKRILVKNIPNFIEKEIKIEGWLYRVRRLKSITFLLIRDRSGLVQCVIENNNIDLSSLKLESVVSIVGIVKKSNNSLNPFEILVESFEIISEAHELPIELNKKELDVNLDTILNNRAISIRHEKVNSIFKIQNIIVQSFREFLINKGFTEIFTPKIVAEGAEGGTEVFKVEYFEKTAYLAQSPQFYKQMMVGAGFERVFEVAHVYRAEQHNTSRHLNEYISMDLEIGFINDEFDIMNLEEDLIKFILKAIEVKGKEYLKILNVNIPKIDVSIPKIELNEAIEILKKVYGKGDLEGDLDPEGEKLICKYAKEKYGCDFIFLTNYPKRKRPMYTMPFEEQGTRSFDLLFKGVEITTGGQRINDYNMLIKSIENKGLNPKDYESYTDIFRYGMPKHGGLAIGLERITTQLLNLENVREASLIPRDRTRITP
ncbi:MULTISPECIES: aspartate--tRNA(Asn) ligase [Clostridium]|jgi:nondiscriminating aspartyl-tRNA synthetase|uniref:aspartate--tRNA(Asn) ligase n=1 Tax=Clostridium TaxID=1485 RepID=UPI00019B018C|nr:MULTISPECIES: aspartate--tRNA(Asn) ligase [Clostridium]EEH98441.1 aspartate-tRNA ligase [Clostridium sp. 7_2_43FAA]MBU6137378.1 aspartate--tRNA(Asn) ligase [Clostridium tertium]MDB1940056.1 aspartate--tRNA(Asn) ligase [Clostridium tertium]MDU2682255.1 aspartate--tRNA(Asn) ligase [Clostridium sp.]MDU8965914.1 aspartate--tRNA(Asn) ligase [Clostridium sp.]